MVALAATIFTSLTSLVLHFFSSLKVSFSLQTWSNTWRFIIIISSDCLYLKFFNLPAVRFCDVDTLLNIFLALLTIFWDPPRERGPICDIMKTEKKPFSQ